MHLIFLLCFLLIFPFVLRYLTKFLILFFGSFFIVYLLANPFIIAYGIICLVLFGIFVFLFDIGKIDSSKKEKKHNEDQVFFSQEDIGENKTEEKKEEFAFEKRMIAKYWQWTKSVAFPEKDLNEGSNSQNVSDEAYFSDISFPALHKDFEKSEGDLCEKLAKHLKQVDEDDFYAALEPPGNPFDTSRDPFAGSEIDDSRENRQ